MDTGVPRRSGILQKKVSGLIEKYDITEESSGTISGIYLFETKASRGYPGTRNLQRKFQPGMG
jgi:hypothetical protein